MPKHSKKKCNYHRNKIRREKYKQKSTHKSIKDSITLCSICEGKQFQDFCRNCKSLYRRKRYETKGGKYKKREHNLEISITVVEKYQTLTMMQHFSVSAEKNLNSALIFNQRPTYFRNFLAKQCEVLYSIFIRLDF